MARKTDTTRGMLYKIDTASGVIKVYKQKGKELVDPDFVVDNAKELTEKFLEKQGGKKGVFYLQNTPFGSHNVYNLLSEDFERIGQLTFDQRGIETRIEPKFRERGFATLLGSLAIDHREDVHRALTHYWWTTEKESAQLARNLGFKEQKPGKPRPKRLLEYHPKI